MEGEVIANDSDISVCDDIRIFRTVAEEYGLTFKTVHA